MFMFMSMSCLSSDSLCLREGGGGDAKIARLCQGHDDVTMMSALPDLPPIYDGMMV